MEKRVRIATEIAMIRVAAISCEATTRILTFFKRAILGSSRGPCYQRDLSLISQLSGHCPLISDKLSVIRCFLRDRQGTPKNLCDKDYAELSGELSGVICLKTLLLLGSALESFRIFFGAVRAIFWLWGSLAPELFPKKCSVNGLSLAKKRVTLDFPQRAT